jgi:hypothetical protein
MLSVPSFILLVERSAKSVVVRLAFDPPTPFLIINYLSHMKYIITESQLNFLKEQTSSNLTTPEQTLLGFLNRFLRGEDGEFENTSVSDLKKTMTFNDKTIYPMAQKLLVKKNTGKKTYDDKTFNAMFMAMDKAITKEQRYEFFKDAENITNITYNSQY